ncbi:MAG: ornithine cyclodeaminase [Pseudomonadota bacterium]|nr:ornithine cyclodeaminase [Pseudomonadota bacterium]
MDHSTGNFHIGGEEIAASIRFQDLVDALASMHREAPAILKDMLLEQPGREGQDHLLVRAAWQAGEALGVKMASIFPGNRELGLPAVHAAYILLDGLSGIPLLSIDGNALTHLKTAADSALGSRMLAREDCHTLLMVGAGAMAPHLIEGHCAVRPCINRVLVWNRSPERRDELVRGLAGQFDISAADDLATAVGQADIISCATMTVEPLIQGEWLQPGTHLDLVGAFRPDMREADDQVLRKGCLFVDSRLTTIGEIGEVAIPMATGVLSVDDILADHYELCTGSPGRTDDSQITVFKNGGGGHLDLMTARYIRKTCRGQEIGSSPPPD